MSSDSKISVPIKRSTENPKHPNKGAVSGSRFVLEDEARRHNAYALMGMT